MRELDLPAVREHFWDEFFIEGWQIYALHLADEAGWFAPDPVTQEIIQ